MDLQEYISYVHSLPAETMCRTRLMLVLEDLLGKCGQIVSTWRRWHTREFFKVLGANQWFLEQEPKFLRGIQDMIREKPESSIYHTYGHLLTLEPRDPLEYLKEPLIRCSVPCPNCVPPATGVGGEEVGSN